MSIEYASVAQNSIILCDSGNKKKFRSFVDKFLGEMEDEGITDERKSLTYDGFVFYYIQKGDFIYLCVCEDDFNDRVAFVFLEKFIEKFQPSASQRFEEKLGDLMEVYAADGGFDKIDAIKSQLEGVKQVMRENMEKAFERGDWLNSLETKTQDLENNSNLFKNRTRDLKNKLCMKNVKFYATIGVVIFAVLVVIILLACGITFQKCPQNTTNVE